MGRCCVPGCRGNYYNGPKVRVFSFPTDEGLRAKWLRSIPRKDFVPSKHSRICEEHFANNCFITTLTHYDECTGKTLEVNRTRTKLSQEAVPTRFPNCPSYLSVPSTTLREAPDAKRARADNIALEEAIQQSLVAHKEEIQNNLVSSFEEFTAKLLTTSISNFWTKTGNARCVMFLRIEMKEAPYVKHSVTVHLDMSVVVCIEGVTIKVLPCGSDVPEVLSDLNTFLILLERIEQVSSLAEHQSLPKKTTALNFVSTLLQDLATGDSELSEDDKASLKFLNEQICMLIAKTPHYSSDFMVFASILHSISPHVYHFARSSSSIMLPHPTTIRRLCSRHGGDPLLEQENKCFLGYMKERAKVMREEEKIVTLMLDEIHIKPYFDYKGGTVTGASNNTAEPATTAHVFMVQSVLSSSKDVVHILPVSRMDAKTLHEFVRKLIIRLEAMGIQVIAIVTDNNALNRKMVSFFASPPKTNVVYPHPADKSRPLFYVVDPVHLIKCVRNNWLNQKNLGKCFYFPEFLAAIQDNSGTVKAASFQALRALHTQEQNKLLKFGYKLTAKALNPTSLERQNVKLALNIFSPFVSEALRTRGVDLQIELSATTADFIDIVVKWWKIVNVKSPHKGTRLKDALQEPIYSIEDTKVQFLSDLVNWLDTWKNLNCDTGTLTKETHAALELTTYSLIELCRYCLEELKFKFVLLGKFQTDSLEDRFRKYRQLAGAQYHISIRQVFESEKKLCLQKMLVLVPPPDTIDEEQSAFNVLITEDDLQRSQCDMPVIAYVAGYSAHAALKRVRCEACAELLVIDGRVLEVEDLSLISHLTRGGLKFPQPCTVTMVLITKLVVEKLSAPENVRSFLKSGKQRSLVMAITLSLLQEALDLSNCSIGHSASLLMRHVVSAATNTLLKNYCGMINDAIQQKAQKVQESRKAKTLSKK